MVNRSRLVIPVVVTMLWIAVPAEAGHRGRACPDGVGCVWDEINFHGRRAQVPSTGCIDATIKSAVNASDRVLEFFRGAGCYGLRVGSLQPGDETAEINAGSATGDCARGPVNQCSDEPVSP